MPDLSHRPTRYAVAGVAAAVLGTWGAHTFDVRIGGDSRAVALQRERDALATRLRDLQAAQSSSNAAPVRRADQRFSTLPVPSHVVTATTAFHGQASCAGYPNQEAAQAAFDANHALVALDGDGDGRACEQLKSKVPQVVTRTLVEPAAPPHQAVPATRKLPSAPTRAAILASRQHFGLYTATDTEAAELQSSLARETTMRGYFKGWDTGFDRNAVIEAWADKQLPVMTWESRPLSGTSDDTDYSLARIAAGDFDSYLTTYARSVTALGLPLAIRFDQEMNGNWYRWSEFESTNGTKKGDYVAAWRHIHDIFQAQGANSLVTWVWSPNRIDNLGRYPAIDGYYPGDDYVDWVGMTGYFRPGDKDPTFAGTYDKTLAALHRVAPSKHVLLSEVGATEDGGKKAAWTQSFFAGLAQHPEVVGFLWFNYAVSENGHTNDWRIDSSPAVFAAAAAGLDADALGRPVGKSWVLPGVVSSEPGPSAAPTQVNASPVNAPPASPEPAEPVEVKPVDAKPVADPVDPVPVAADPVEADPVDPQPAAPDQGATQPALPLLADRSRFGLARGHAS